MTILTRKIYTSGGVRGLWQGASSSIPRIRYTVTSKTWPWFCSGSVFTVFSWVFLIFIRIRETGSWITEIGIRSKIEKIPTLKKKFGIIKFLKIILRHKKIFVLRFMSYLSWALNLSVIILFHILVILADF